MVEATRHSIRILTAALLPVATWAGAAPARAAAPAATRLEGVVHDPTGAAVAQAAVSVEGGGDTARAVSDASGRFAVDWRGPREVTVTVEAPGFPRARRAMVVGDGPLDLLLTPAAFQDKVTVTASRRLAALGETAASAVVLSSADLRATAGIGTDDALRQVPGFTLFRRTPSRSANPTTQGATLRGLAGSGASRALVLEDGVPLNDPFGGWVYWGRVPRVAIERLEVVRGGGSDLYGSAALAGVVQVVRQGTDVPRLDSEFVTGQQGIANGALFAAGRRGRWGGRVAGEVFSTSGYFAIPTDLRGAVDHRLTSRHHGGDVTLERALGSGRIFVRGGGYHDARNNGTVLQENDTTINQGVIGLDLGGLRVRGDLSHQDYDQTFSAIAADRKTERLTTDQHVPARTSGVSLQWTRPLGSHVLVLGAEHRAVWGRSEEDNFNAGGTVLRTTGGGRQHATGLFAEDAWSLGRRLVVQGAVRLDRWRNFDGQQTSGASVTPLGDRGETATSPRGALLFKVARRLSLTAGAYRAFRAPTLNELYRSFRVGNVLTLASSDLAAEKARGYEGGALIGLGEAVSLRATAFTMDADNTVANVTLSTTPSLITRQRRNLGSIRSRGVELDGEARMGAHLVLSASAAWLDAHVRAAAERALVGRRVPQVPLRQAGLQLRYDTPRGFTGGLQARVVSQQYEDDLNTLSLAGYWTVDALVGHALNEWVGLFVAGENLRNVQYDVGRTPLRTVGPPRTLRVGLRVRLAGHPSPP
ncbi:MAG: hypothetical protein DMF78_10515 [Acidobacteria bacterium]|nr:MAG: hypothetical protein DMF78_10515 [Acidobacteriota bacterium]